jgi:hypothetical protein
MVIMLPSQPDSEPSVPADDALPLARPEAV